MKIRNKLFLITFLFVGIIFVCNSKSYCAEPYESKENIPKNTPYYEYFIDNMPDVGNYIIIEYVSSSNEHLVRACAIPASHLSLYYCISYSSSLRLFQVMEDAPDCIGTDVGKTYTKEHCTTTITLSSDSSVSSSKYEGYISYGLSKNGADNLKVLYSTTTLYFYEKGSDGVTRTYEFGQQYVPPEPENTFIDMYELNLTDLDYNNTVHQFKIGSYEDSSCYDELMEYYFKDCPYAIFITDYQRILTYGEENNDNSFQYGSYLLSGYIDFLTTDKSYFYYSYYNNKVLSDSGNTFFNKGIEDYKRRFTFKLVYSEDSNDPNAQKWISNGDLKLASVFDEPEHSYFVGSSNTIYYANEKNGKKQSLSNDIYYKGYLNHTGGKVISLDKYKFYRYDFSFGGGTTKILFLNSANYENDRNKAYDDLNNQYYDTDKSYIEDTTDGNSYIQGDDEKTSTYDKGDVTDDTSEEEDKKHIGEIRTDATPTNKTDTTNWSILDFLRGIFNALTGNDTDTSGTTNAINSSVDTIQDKFAFKDNIVNNANEIKNYIVNTQATHKYYLNLNHKYLSGSVCIIDLSWYEPYKSTVDAFICAFAYLAFMWRMFCIIPSLIRGASAGSYLNEIATYNVTSQLHSIPTIGRSENIHNRRNLN